MLDTATEPSESSATSLQAQIRPSASSDGTQLDLLLSLDIALQLIHADREALKRVESFTGYSGHYGHRVHDTMEEVFILMLQAIGDRHVSVGFTRSVNLRISIRNLANRNQEQLTACKITNRQNTQRSQV